MRHHLATPSKQSMCHIT